MANVIAQLDRPTLVLTHNKTLTAQLYGEFQTFSPKNAPKTPPPRAGWAGQGGAARHHHRRQRLVQLTAWAIRRITKRASSAFSKAWTSGSFLARKRRRPALAGQGGAAESGCGFLYLLNNDPCVDVFGVK